MRVLAGDIGGTKVAAGLVDSKGEILYKTRVPMVSTGDAALGFSAVREAIEAVFCEHPKAKGALAGIGICSPGPLDPKTGLVINPPNLPCWRNFPLAAEVEKVFGVKAAVENDANAAALAEAIWGAGIGYRNIFYATLGTGIGTGIVFDKVIYNGRTGSASEGGHLTIDYKGPVCGCGKRGCIEILASGPAIARLAREKVSQSAAAGKVICQLAGSLDEIKAEHVGQAYKQGDPLAAEILQEIAHLLTVWLGNVCDVLEPDAIIVGGGVSDLMYTFFDSIRANLPDWCIIKRAGEIPLLRAKYGSDAGIAGAAALTS